MFYELQDHVAASMDGLEVGKDAREMDLELRVKVVAGCVEVTPVDRLVDPAHDLDVRLRHDRPSIAQVDLPFTGWRNPDGYRTLLIEKG